MTHSSVPELRIRSANRADLRPDGEFVLYWMIANRRPGWNFSLQWAADLAVELGRPLVVLEPLRIGYRWASDRIHAFVAQGMADNLVAFDGIPGVVYHPYIEPTAGAGRGLLGALAGRACAVITDDFPCFFLPRMIAAAAETVDVSLQAVDSNGLLPLRQTDRVFPSAHTFRRHLHKSIRPHLDEFPKADPLKGLKLPALQALPDDVLERWPAATAEQLAGKAAAFAGLDIDHDVAPSKLLHGGHRAAARLTTEFLKSRLGRYPDERNQPQSDAASGLSPYLHFGHASAHAVFSSLTEAEGWTPEQLAPKPTGSREGWWGMSPAAEAFVDELITWREVGYNFTSKRADYDAFESLPDFALKTLREHASDDRPYVYTPAQLDRGETHDRLWNAAQNQLVREGRMHNYLRMLWGKKILEWSPGPEEALEVMIELNNRYALDGRNPNSYSGIFWVLGRYDRAWGPERPIFGKIRYMSSDNTARKVKVKEYVEQYAGANDLFA